MTAFRDAKTRSSSEHMLIIARIESFTCRKVIKDDPVAEEASIKEALSQALERAAIYRDVSADAIMIHSKSKSPDEILSFLRQFRTQDSKTPCKFPILARCFKSLLLTRRFHLSPSGGCANNLWKRA